MPCNAQSRDDPGRVAPNSTVVSGRIQYGDFHALAKTAKCRFDGTGGAAL
jgi:hypothetical protein